MGRFRKGERRQLRLRMLIDGPAKSGKSVTALRCAHALGDRVAVIEAGEWGSTEKYIGETWDGRPPWAFDITQLESFSPEEYTAAIEDAARAGYEVIIIDSLSHEWNGKDGTLQIADKPGLFGGWRTATPLHDRMFEAILNSPCHVIATCRSKMDYVIQTNEKGKAEPVRVGLAPIQRDTAPYEFDVLLSMDQAHVGTVSGSRCRAIEGASVVKPGAEFMRPIIAWLQTGTQGPAPTVTARINPVQLDRIAELLGQLGWPLDRIAREFPKRYGVSELARLNRDQADGLIKWLEGHAKATTAKNRLEKPAEVPPAATNGHASGSAGDQPSQAVPDKTTAPPKVSAAQLARLGELREEIFRRQGVLDDKERCRQEWLKALAKYNVTTATALDREQADDLTRRLNFFLQKLDMADHLTDKPAPSPEGGQPAVAGTKIETAS